MQEIGDLFPIVAQDEDTKDVLMLAYGNEETLALSKETGWMHYWSRSRKKVWRKGESSGNGQKLVSIKWDCDHDAVLATVQTQGPACHTGTLTCFGEPERDHLVPGELWRVFRDRERKSPADSYVAKLLGDPVMLRKKIVEEGVEFILASQEDGNEEIVHEAADLLFHIFVLLYQSGVTFPDVLRELRRRRR